MNWKYLISNSKEDVIIVKSQFNKKYEDWATKNSWMNLIPFNPTNDINFINEKKFVLLEDNIKQLIPLKKAFIPVNDEKEDWDFLENFLGSFFKEWKIHSKWEVCIYEKDWEKIYEVNSLNRIKEFWDNFLQFKELVMFSNTELINFYLQNLLWTFVEVNINKFDNLFNIQKWININEKICLIKNGWILWVMLIYLN